MGLIKKHYQKFITYGLIILGILSFIAILIIHPQKISAKEIYNFSSEPKLTEISFPFSQEIPITTTKVNYIEVYFGNDSINNHDYTVSVLKSQETLFKHTYANEQSNIIQLPLAEFEFQPEDSVTLQIACNNICNNVKFELYDTKAGPSPKIAVISHATDYRYFWYAGFLIIIGLTLIPLAKEAK